MICAYGVCEVTEPVPPEFSQMSPTFALKKS